MKSTSITEFRKTFHKLDEPVIVTALGRPIGTYVPDSAVTARSGSWAAIREAKGADFTSAEGAARVTEQLKDMALVPPKGK